MILPEALQVAIDELNKFPGIGRKTAQRLALHLLKKDKEDVEKLISALRGLKDNLNSCSRCFNICQSDLCVICSSPKREQTLICVVEEANDIFAIERTNQYQGLYHVIGGALSPLAGIGPEDLRIRELLERIKIEPVSEIILALNPTTEGETTALYLQRLLKPLDIRITRIARGLPIGGDIEFSDEATIGRAISARVDMV